MKKEIKYIFLVWRKGKGSRRIKVGRFRRNAHGYTFRYIKEGVEAAMKDGFKSYPDFPDTDESRVYSNNVLQSFACRLNNSERSDYPQYLEYWEVSADMAADKYYMLAKTQALLPTDNFELIAEYNPVRGISFITEICGLSYSGVTVSDLHVGDELTWKCERNNSEDKFAVKLYNGDRFVGYVKIVHNKVFHEMKRGKFHITVKSIDGTDNINRCFIKVFSE